ncbi:hypothetical protein GQR58_026116 [Nymphon striatum]|nr:hypothetical protein GQR58_026116 [Nymphon striatum]
MQDQRHPATTTTTSIIIDGAAIVQMLKPAACKNFREYAQKIFIPYMSTRFQYSSHLDLVWDTYRADSLKASARAKRDKQLVVTDGEKVCSKPPLSELSLLAPCTHEEADSRIVLYVSHASRHGHNKIMIRTVDTVVVVLAVSVIQHLQPENELWFAFRTGKGSRYLAAHEVAAGLGQIKHKHLRYIDKARKKLFARKNNVELIPPTKATLEEHVKRAAYQVGHVWGQVLLPAPKLLEETSWGWTKSEEGLHEPHWTRLPQAAKIFRELLSCKCKKGCVNRCKYKKAALECTTLCLCEGECTQN